jgi:hypothetical protein
MCMLIQIGARFFPLSVVLIGAYTGAVLFVHMSVHINLIPEVRVPKVHILLILNPYFIGLLAYCVLRKTSTINLVNKI